MSGSSRRIKPLRTAPAGVGTLFGPVPLPPSTSSGPATPTETTRRKECWKLVGTICKLSAKGPETASVVQNIPDPLAWTQQIGAKEYWDIFARSLKEPLTQADIPRHPMETNDVGIYAHVIWLEMAGTGVKKPVVYVGSAMGEKGLRGRNQYYDRVLRRCLGWKKKREKMAEHGLLIRLSDREFARLDSKEKQKEKWRPHKVISDVWMVLWSLPYDQRFSTLCTAPDAGPALRDLYRQYQSRDVNLARLGPLLRGVGFALEGWFMLGAGDAPLKGAFSKLLAVKEKKRDPAIWLDGITTLNQRFTAFERCPTTPRKAPSIDDHEKWQKDFDRFNWDRFPRCRGTIDTYRARPGQVYDDVDPEDFPRLERSIRSTGSDKVIQPRALALIKALDFDDSGRSKRQPLRSKSPDEATLFSGGTSRQWKDLIIEGLCYDTVASEEDHADYRDRSPAPWTSDDIVIPIPGGTTEWSVEIGPFGLDKHGLPVTTATDLSIVFHGHKHPWDFRKQELKRLSRQYGKALVASIDEGRALGAFAVVLRISLAFHKLKKLPTGKFFEQRSWNSEVFEPEGESAGSQGSRKSYREDGRLALAESLVGDPLDEFIDERIAMLSSSKVLAAQGPYPPAEVMRSNNGDPWTLIDKSRLLLGANKMGYLRTLDDTWTETPAPAVLPVHLTTIGTVTVHRLSIRDQLVLALIRCEGIPFSSWPVDTQVDALKEISTAAFAEMTDTYIDLAADRRCFLQWHDNITPQEYVGRDGYSEGPWVQIDVVDSQASARLPDRWRSDRDHSHSDAACYFASPDMYTVPSGNYVGDHTLEALQQAIERVDCLALVGFLHQELPKRWPTIAIMTLQHTLSTISFGRPLEDEDVDEPLESGPIVEYLVRYCSQSDGLDFRLIRALALHCPGTLVPLEFPPLVGLNPDLSLLAQVVENVPWSVAQSILVVTDDPDLGRHLAVMTSPHWAVWLLEPGPPDSQDRSATRSCNPDWLVLTPAKVYLRSEEIPIERLRQVDVHTLGDDLFGLSLHIIDGKRRDIDVQRSGTSKEDAVWKWSRWVPTVKIAGHLRAGEPLLDEVLARWDPQTWLDRLRVMFRPEDEADEEEE